MVKPLLYEQQLVAQVRSELVAAKEFHIATALVSLAGVNTLYQSLEKCIEKGGSGKVLVGVDLPSHPDAIERLLSLKTQYPGQLELKYFRPLKRRIFHPKLFLFKRRNGKGIAIIGSSNLTAGGLEENYEANVWMELSGAANQLFEYFEEHFEGAYSSRVTPDWIAGYREEWRQRKKLLDKLHKLRQRTQAITQKLALGTGLPKRLKDKRLSFTGRIIDWPREHKLYPLVRRLGGELVEAKGISKADFLIHAEIMGGRKTTRKLRGARKFGIPVITEEDFWRLIRREESVRARKRRTG
jgi:HKD family nuclease